MGGRIHLIVISSTQNIVGWSFHLIQSLVLNAECSCVPPCALCVCSWRLFVQMHSPIGCIQVLYYFKSKEMRVRERLRAPVGFSSYYYYSTGSNLGEERRCIDSRRWNYLLPPFYLSHFPPLTAYRMGKKGREKNTCQLAIECVCVCA